MQTETKGLTLPCIECRVELEESAMLEFGGGVACEKCVADYYRNSSSYREFPAEQLKELIEVEVQTRRRGAALWLKSNRRQLEKKVARKAFRAGPH